MMLPAYSYMGALGQDALPPLPAIPPLPAPPAPDTGIASGWPAAAIVFGLGAIGVGWIANSPLIGAAGGAAAAIGALNYPWRATLFSGYGALGACCAHCAAGGPCAGGLGGYG